MIGEPLKMEGGFTGALDMGKFYLFKMKTALEQNRDCAKNESL